MKPAEQPEEQQETAEDVPLPWEGDKNE